MANYIELPVYKAAYDLLLQIFNLTHNLNREYKYTLGEKLKNEITELLSNIYRANRIKEKEQYLRIARENLELVRLYIRILKDLKQIANKKHIFINQSIEQVSKQLAGWHKSIQK
ncbi:MAG: four helix bundle protein [Bacteroidota bacterium]|nr:four helix bundle protein [Bacteroidota bacterium]